MIRVWTDNEEAGWLDRHATRGSSFVYRPSALPERAVSMTMPIRAPSYNAALGLLPIFEMNLPEGALRERLRLSFAKASGAFDDLDLLGIVGRSQIGRIRYTGENQTLDQDVPFQSIEDILGRSRGGGLLRYLVEQFASYSGISGVQPKVLVRDEGASAALDRPGSRHAHSFRGATHLVKFWDANEYPQLAANEFFCLRVAERCGLPVPRYRLSEDALALVIDRFDLRPDGTYHGFEDFCVLNARRTDQKYLGSYETSVLRRFAQFANSSHLGEDLEHLLTLIVVNCALRNGDAHLKNFGILYDEVQGEARLAPAYDLVTTAAYLPQDCMALTLNGTAEWPSAKSLQRLGETRTGSSPARVRQTLERVGDAVASTAAELRLYQSAHAEFSEIGSRMLAAWEEGTAHSLRAAQST